MLVPYVEVSENDEAIERFLHENVNPEIARRFIEGRDALAGNDTEKEHLEERVENFEAANKDREGREGRFLEQVETLARTVEDLQEAIEKLKADIEEKPE